VGLPPISTPIHPVPPCIRFNLPENTAALQRRGAFSCTPCSLSHPFDGQQRLGDWVLSVTAPCYHSRLLDAFAALCAVWTSVHTFLGLHPKELCPPASHPTQAPRSCSWHPHRSARACSLPMSMLGGFAPIKGVVWGQGRRAAGGGALAPPSRFEIGLGFNNRVVAGNDPILSLAPNPHPFLSRITAGTLWGSASAPPNGPSTCTALGSHRASCRRIGTG
jgi:hypothetical protein